MIRVSKSCRVVCASHQCRGSVSFVRTWQKKTAMTTRILTVALVLSCGVLLAQERPSQEVMVRILESTGTPADVKLRVLYEVRKIKPEDREPVLVNYIRDEVA